MEFELSWRYCLQGRKSSKTDSYLSKIRTSETLISTDSKSLREFGFQIEDTENRESAELGYLVGNGDARCSF